MNPLLLGAGMLVTGILLFWEWRRPNRRHLVFRCISTILAVLALALLFRPASNQSPSASRTEATLLTTGGPAPPAFSQQTPPPFALPDATGHVPTGTRFMPDMGTLRRRFPNLRTLHIFGHGLDPAELPALTGLHLDFHPPSTFPSTPALRFLRAPRELPLGQPLIVTGRVAGLAPGTNLPVSLESPDGARSETPTDPADAHGEAAFTLRAAPLPAAGRFVWQLRVGRATQPLGVSIVPPVLPRVLVLEGEPHFDTAAMRRWYEGADGTLTVRTQVGKANTRFAAARDKPPAVGAVDAALLTGFDLVLADGSALAGLPPEERAALTTAVEKTGLGLLVRADAAVLPPDTPKLPPDLLPFFPWKLKPVGEAAPGEERPVRPQWLGQAAVSGVPVSAVPFVVEPTDPQTVLVSDREARALVATVPRGRGQMALTLVRATTRWQRENESPAFAAYWSFLFSRLARPHEPTGRWSLVDGDAGPVFVDHPLTLRWSGPPDASPAPGHVVAAADSTDTTLPLAQDAREPDTWHGTFWPCQPGWHRVTAASGGRPLDFYVHPADAWLDLQTARRRDATARFAAESTRPSASTPPPPAPSHHLHPGWCFLLFVVAAGYLWTERRFAAV